MGSSLLLLTVEVFLLRIHERWEPEPDAPDALYLPEQVPDTTIVVDNLISVDQVYLLLAGVTVTVVAGAQDLPDDPSPVSDPGGLVQEPDVIDDVIDTWLDVPGEDVDPGELT